LGFSNFCCHPLLGTDRISVYPEGTDCSAAKPSSTPETLIEVTYPDTCDQEITVQPLDPQTGENISGGKSGKALCSSLQ
jgi:hypothetical protein